MSGTLKGKDIQLIINEFGQDISLTGTFPSGTTSNGFASGEYSTVTGGCSFPSTGNWSAVQIPALTGPFHGTITDTNDSTGAIVTININGTMSQGPNIGASNETLFGTMTVSQPFTQSFCAIPLTMTISGVISGTSATLLFYDANGNPLSIDHKTATATADGTSLASSFSFPQVSSSCPASGASTQLKITFP